MNESKGPPKKANDAWEVAVVIKGFYLMCRTRRTANLHSHKAWARVVSRAKSPISGIDPVEDSFLTFFNLSSLKLLPYIGVLPGSLGKGIRSPSLILFVRRSLWLSSKVRISKVKNLIFLSKLDENKPSKWLRKGMGCTFFIVHYLTKMERLIEEKEKDIH
ncbi:hypothetical protein LIER_29844 [Lithospermum erythrorhizon]|uniref:Uncharacterized protein n=1 Tax=Lithospermum erythrorhizon TaxID=34254 RepID=A0AAV3RP60_LITER